MRETKFWSPDTCSCHINIQFNDADPNPDFSYATQAEAELIRRERHEFFVAKHIAEEDQRALQGRLKKYAAWTSPNSDEYNPLEPTIGLEHAMLPENNALLDNLFDENRRKNIAQGIIRVGRPDLTEEDIPWSFTGTGTDRVLHLQYMHMADDHLPFQAQMDLQFGPGKVVVE